MLAHLKKTTLAVVARRLDPLLHLTAATGLRLCRTPEDEGTGGNGEVGLLVRLGPLEFVRDVRFCAPQAHARADEIAMEYSVRAAKQQQIHRLEARGPRGGRKPLR